MTASARPTPPPPLHRIAPRSARAHAWRALVTAGAAVTMVVVGASAYTIQRGDTLTDIARRHDTTVAALVAANGITDPDLIIAGDALTIPGSGDATDDTDDDGAGDAAQRPADDEPAPAPRASAAGTSVAPLGPTGDAGDKRVHVVAPGDTAQSIASQYGIPVAQFMAANGLTDASQLLGGARVQMAATAPSPGTGTPGAGAYEVVAGDTLIRIADLHATTVAALVAANGLPDASFIRVGQVLDVPGGGTGFVCPVPDADFINDWGVAKPDGRFHQGVDLKAPVGTPVLAPTAGTVHQITGTRGGLQFRLDGDDGYVHYGSHLDSFGASGRVAAGDVIGTVGTSGNAVGGPPHLHYSVRFGDGLINPYPSLRAAC